MAKTYDEWKDWLIVFLWKDGDSVLLTRLDELTVMAETELSRKLDIENREKQLTLTGPGTNDNIIPLPADFKQMIALNTDRFEYKRITEGQIDKSSQINVSNEEQPFYSTIGKNLHVSQTYKDTDTYEFRMVYRTTMGSYKVDDVSILEDQYLDLFTYTTLKHTAPFLREDERVALWTGLANDALTSVLYEDKHNINFGGELASIPIRNASPRLRNGGHPLSTRR